MARLVEGFEIQGGGGEAAYTESYTVKWPICHADGSHQAP